uniref:RecBCD enzyme subunit RecD n=1 Tax=Candidatus Aschnera chinzeii TaxID=1485666 RepID=A0AAT9G4T5_9ENTR|nr:MAG: exodeoxyribonuclease V subunit alpha [Candidatus Aschnera chinzeii]
MIKLLKKAVILNILEYIDLQIAIMLVKDNNPILLLIFTLLSYNTRLGHTCLLINKINFNFLFKICNHQIAYEIWDAAGSPDNNIIYHKIKYAHAVSNTINVKKPLILINNKLYFQRMWNNEGIVANFFKSNLTQKINTNKLSSLLNSLFIVSKDINWQKLAIIIAVTNKISIISGGPGTGKTTIISDLIYILLKLNNQLIIKLAAPTGKAAVKLTFALQNFFLKFHISPKQQIIFPTFAQTIHSLLGINMNLTSAYYNINNKLLLDVLIIDEASMIDLSMMVKLIHALPKHAYLILLGDKDQLGSVEPGSIFYDLCSYANYGYDNKTIKQIQNITGYKLNNLSVNDDVKINNIICILQKNYRFNKTSNIGNLATAIKNGDINHVNTIITKQTKNIIFDNINNPDSYQQFFLNIVNNYYKYLVLIKTYNYNNILNTFNQYRLLVALKNGPYGVIQLNNTIEKILYRKKIINLSLGDRNKNYEGRPIIITQNNYNLGLFNGDIGILLKDTKSTLKAFFQFPNGNIKHFTLTALPPYETAFAMTIHKSQGSEFENISILLPSIDTPIVTKELIYTAITRAKKQINICGNKNVFLQAIKKVMIRDSGLVERLSNK